MDTKDLSIAVDRQAGDGSVIDYCIPVASRLESGIWVSGYYQRYDEGLLNSFELDMLDYLHPEIFDALTSDLPPETWNPAIHIERPKGKTRKRS